MVNQLYISFWVFFFFSFLKSGKKSDKKQKQPLKKKKGVKWVANILGFFLG